MTMPGWVVEPTLFGDVVRDASRAAEPDASRVARADVSPRSARGGRDVCLWCAGAIPAASRRDALCCSKRCRQARHRFTTAVGAPPDTSRRPACATARLAYADPPYPGKAWLYRDHPDFAGEVDQAALIRRLSTYDGWALSTSAAALPAVLASCGPGVRVAAWCRGERPVRAAGPVNGWEPVIYSPARAPVRPAAQRVVDTLVHFSRPRLTDPRRVVGAKPAAFARWIFDLLGAQPGDAFDDLFPGSGTIARAWAIYAGTVAPVDERDASCSAAVERDASSLEVLHDASRLQQRG